MSVAEEVQHSFLACGSHTYIVDEAGAKTWTYPQATRDGYVLPSGKIVLALNGTSQHPGGSVVEVDRDGAERLIWAGTQSEVNSVQPTDRGTYVITEAGPKPRLLELDREGKILLEFPLQCQSENHHMETRMARQLSDGTFLVPHLLDFAVRHYDRSGHVLGSFDTTAGNDPEHAIHTWPFTAIRHGKSRTLVCCTNGNRVIDFDADGKILWQLTNEDLPGEWLQDPCGAQVLPNDNVVITSYAAGGKDPQAPKLIEVTPEKEVVWTHRDGESHGIHHFQILTTNGQQLPEPPQK
ncbi:MAG: hypothetical protein ABI557_18620 [Aureliella sp.]